MLCGEACCGDNPIGMKAPLRLVEDAIRQKGSRRPDAIGHDAPRDHLRGAACAAAQRVSPLPALPWWRLLIGNSGGLISWFP
jgi:hypothetical protein